MTGSCVRNFVLPGPADGSISMPKQKTHKGVKKRFRVTANGKVKHRQAGTSHLAARKTHKRKRMLRGTTTLASEFTQQIKDVLVGNSY